MSNAIVQGIEDKIERIRANEATARQTKEWRMRAAITGAAVVWTAVSGDLLGGAMTAAAGLAGIEAGRALRRRRTLRQ